MQRHKIMQHLSYISDVNVLPDWMTVEQLLTYTEGFTQVLIATKPMPYFTRLISKQNLAFERCRKG